MIAPPTPPAHDELEALIREARERQLRRRLLGAAGIAIAAALGLSVYALTIGNGAAGGSTRGAHSGPAPLCRSSQLSASAIWDGAAGSLFNVFTVVNRGTGSCSLPTGRPTVILTRRGSRLKVEERAASPAILGPGRPVRTLAPGRRAVVRLQWFNWCGGPHLAVSQAATTVTVRFAHGPRVVARHLLGQPPCMNPAAPSTLGVSPPLTPN